MRLSNLFKLDQRGGKSRRRKDRRTSDGQPGNRGRQRVKMDICDLRVGMYVTALDKPWEESTVMLQAFDIRSAEEIRALRKECQWVWVEMDAAPTSAVPMSAASAAGSKFDRSGFNAHSRFGAALEDELGSALEVHELASNTISHLFEEIRLGAQIDGGKVRQAVNACMDSLLRNQDASVWLTRLRDKHEASAQHSLNVAALSMVLGKSLGMNGRELENIGVCGMLHDIGKTSVSSEVLEKAGPLDAREMAEMQNHTRYGRDILVSTRSVMAGAADVAHAHHERPDGMGYPRKLSAQDIPVSAKIVAIAEAYDTMTVTQPYRQALSPSDALQELYAQRGRQFDEELVVRFIDAVGVFPPGSIVEMLNGEVGIVLSNTKNKLRPRVILIMDAIGEPTPQRVVDLSEMEVDEQGNVYQIKTTHSDGAYGIDVSEFQRAGLRVG